MEFIQRFNAALSSLYDDKLPVSKAKISEITNTALSGVRVYKHIVQSVERFIHKCRPEYKLPALYVIDSIVRHSQHDFRKDRDVYGQRFLRNFTSTFQNLFSTCLVNDKPKIVRVLNLWQKNNVFPPDVIQPLLDLAHSPNESSIPNNNINDLGPISVTTNTTSSSGSSHIHHHNYRSDLDHMTPKTTDSNVSDLNVDRMISEASAAVQAVGRLAIDLDSNQNSDTLVAQLHQLAASLTEYKRAPSGDLFKNLNNETIKATLGLGQQPNKPVYDLSEPEELDDDISTPTEAEPPYPKPSKIKKLNNIAGVVNDKASTLNAFADLVQIFQQQSNNRKTTIQDSMIPSDNEPILDDHHHMNQDDISESLLQKFLNSSAVTSASAALIDSQSENNTLSLSDSSNNYYPHNENNHHDRDSKLDQQELTIQGFVPNDQIQSPKQSSRSISPRSDRYRSSRRDRRHADEYDRHHRYSSRERDYKRSRHSRSRSRSPRSRSNQDRDRTGRSRSRSRSNSSPYRDTTEMEREREERERLREKRRKGYPSIRKDRMTICSTTLWLGHLPKRTTSESDLNDLFGEYGVIQSIDMIPSRGCAFVCMDRRQDAYKAYMKIKSLPKILNSNQVKITWAPGKGLKNKEYKDFWESDIGCSFIPHSSLSEEIDLDQLEEGGVIDEDTIPEKYKELRKIKRQQKKEQEEQQQAVLAQQNSTIVPPPPIDLNTLAGTSASVPINPLIPLYTAPPGIPPAPPVLPQVSLHHLNHAPIHPPGSTVVPPNILGLSGQFPSAPSVHGAVVQPPPPPPPPPVSTIFPHPPPPPPPPISGAHHPGLLPPPTMTNPWMMPRDHQHHPRGIVPPPPPPPPSAHPLALPPVPNFVRQINDNVLIGNAEQKSDENEQVQEDQEQKSHSDNMEESNEQSQQQEILENCRNETNSDDDMNDDSSPCNQLDEHSPSIQQNNFNNNHNWINSFHSPNKSRFHNQNSNISDRPEPHLPPPSHHFPHPPHQPPPPGGPTGLPTPNRFPPIQPPGSHLLPSNSEPLLAPPNRFPGATHPPQILPPEPLEPHFKPHLFNNLDYGEHHTHPPPPHHHLLPPPAPQSHSILNNPNRFGGPPAPGSGGPPPPPFGGNYPPPPGPIFDDPPPRGRGGGPPPPPMPRFNGPPQPRPPLLNRMPNFHPGGGGGIGGGRFLPGAGIPPPRIWHHQDQSHPLPPPIMIPNHQSNNNRNWNNNYRNNNNNNINNNSRYSNQQQNKQLRNGQNHHYRNKWNNNNYNRNQNNNSNDEMGRSSNSTNYNLSETSNSSISDNQINIDTGDGGCGGDDTSGGTAINNNNDDGCVTEQQQQQPTIT